MAVIDTGSFTVTVISPGPDRRPALHEVFDDQATALAEIGFLAIEAPPGSAIVLRDPNGDDLLRLMRT